MNENVKKERKKISPIFMFLLGIIVTAGTVYAVTLIPASEVSFTPSGNIDANNVQSAIEKVYADIITVDSIKQKTDKYNSYSSTATIPGVSEGVIDFNVTSNNFVRDVSVAIVSGTNSFGTGTVSFDVKAYVSDEVYDLVRPSSDAATISNATLYTGTSAFYSTAWITSGSDGSGKYINFNFSPIKLASTTGEEVISNLEAYANGKRIYIKLDYVNSEN